ncbi:MAG: Rieske (2Fe-2S) protein, partial [Pseudomonadota bacterium]|nr:Rieske (2Fe-2S) protein [Pseudomonadota bacterium]
AAPLAAPAKPPAAAAAKAAPPAASTPAAKPVVKPVRTPPPASPLPPEKTADGYRAVALSTQVTDLKAGTFPLDPTTIVAVFRHEGKLWVIDNACAHEDGPVGEGAVTGKCVKCPYHDWEYDYTTGACRTDPERSLATFAVREGDGLIWVGPRLTEGTKARGGDHNDGLETITR